MRSQSRLSRHMDKGERAVCYGGACGQERLSPIACQPCKPWGMRLRGPIVAIVLAFAGNLLPGRWIRIVMEVEATAALAGDGHRSMRSQ